MTDDPDEPAYSHPDPQHSPPREVLRDVAVILRSSLPPPAADTPEGKVRRDRAAMAAVASLQPANAAEGRLAAQFVALDAHSLDCLRLARERHDEPKAALRCIAQATSMMREGKGALGLLLKLQARRRTSAKQAAAANRAAWAEYNASEMTKDAMSAGAVEFLGFRPCRPPAVVSPCRSGSSGSSFSPGVPGFVLAS